MNNPMGRINSFATSSSPTMGVEEEFLLVDLPTDEPAALNRPVAEHSSHHGVDLQLELTSCQLATASGIASSSDELQPALPPAPSGPRADWTAIWSISQAVTPARFSWRDRSTGWRPR